MQVTEFKVVFESGKANSTATFNADYMRRGFNSVTFWKIRYGWRRNELVAWFNKKSVVAVIVKRSTI